MAGMEEVRMAVQLRESGESGSKARAGAVAWARELAEEAGALKEEVKQEESIIKKKIEAIRKVYGNKTPNDLIIDPSTGQKYLPIKMKKILFEHGTRLANFYQGLANLLLPLLERDLELEAKLSALFNKNAKNYGSNLVILKRMKGKVGAIKKKLLNAVAYWTKVRDKTALPWFGNSGKITEPVDDIDTMELNLIAEIEKIINKGRITLVR
jgi:hypothetical protein